jgi:hypothetical protein
MEPTPQQLERTNQQVELAQRKMGRPAAIDESVVTKLIAAFQNGMSVKTACQYARISPKVFYDKAKRDENFSDKMIEARNFQKLKAGEAITETILDKSHRDRARAAMWLLERKEPEEFASKGTLNLNVNARFIPYSWSNEPIEPEESK